MCLFRERGPGACAPPAATPPGPRASAPSAPGTASGVGGAPPTPGRPTLPTSGVGSPKSGFAALGKFLPIMAGVAGMAGLLKQSKIAGAFMKGFMDVIGAMVDIFLMPFVPLLMSVMKSVAEVIPPFMKIIRSIMDVGVWETFKLIAIGTWEEIKVGAVNAFKGIILMIKNLFQEVVYGLLKIIPGQQPGEEALRKKFGERDERGEKSVFNQVRDVMGSVFTGQIPKALKQTSGMVFQTNVTIEGIKDIESVRVTTQDEARRMLHQESGRP